MPDERLHTRNAQAVHAKNNTLHAAKPADRQTQVLRCRSNHTFKKLYFFGIKGVKFTKSFFKAYFAKLNELN